MACAAAAPQLQDLARSIGPLDLQGHGFTLALQIKQLRGAGAVDADFQETVAGMEIRDAGGKAQYRKTFPYKVAGDRFEETLAVHARVLRGDKGTGLLVTYGMLPSTPLGGQSWQVFGVIGGKLVPFSKPLSTEGELVKIASDPRLQADVLQFRVWTGNFFVILPVRLDWLAGRLMPAWRCWKMTSRGPQARCQFQVEAERRPADELTFVRLFPDTDENQGVPEHAVVKKDSRVEFLAAEAALRWEEEPEGIGFGVSEDVWLKVQVDGKEGWIHREEDFRAIGLPAAG